MNRRDPGLRRAPTQRSGGTRPSASGIILFAVITYDFFSRLGQGSFVELILSLLSGLLLVFIFTELISTVRVVIATREVRVEPFLIVGMVAGIRRVIVISAEAKDLVGTRKFRDAMVEIGVLTTTVLVLGATVFLLRFGRGREQSGSGAGR